MFQDEEVKVEQPAIDQLMKQGWSYVPGALLAPAVAAKGLLHSAEREYYA